MSLGCTAAAAEMTPAYVTDISRSCTTQASWSAHPLYALYFPLKVDQKAAEVSSLCIPLLFVHMQEMALLRILL